MQKKTIRTLLAKIQDKDPTIAMIVTTLDEDAREEAKASAALLVLMAGIMVGVIVARMWIQGAF